MRRLTNIIIAGVATVALATVAFAYGSTARSASHHPANTLRLVANHVGSKRVGSPGDPAGHPHIQIDYVQGVNPDAVPSGYGFDFRLYNNTPYIWTLDPTETTNEYPDGNGCRCWQLAPWPNVAPPRTLQPGEVMHLVTDGDLEPWVGYTFTDASHVRHLAQIRVCHCESVTYYNLYAYSNDWYGTHGTGDPDAGWHDAIDVFQMADQPGAPANSKGAFMKQPVDINIDATTNPDGAAQALTYFQDSDPNTRSFKPTAPPSWSQSDRVPGSAKLINTSSAEAELTASTGTINTESTSLSEKVSWELEFGLFDVANAGVNASIESGQEWSTSNEAENGNSMPVEPGHQGWFTKRNQVQNVTGNFDFAIPDWKVTYHITNATFSMPGLTHKGADGIPIPGTSFTPYTEEYHPPSKTRS